MSKWFIILSIIISNQTLCQRVNQKSAKILLQDYSFVQNDGLLFFEIEVRMADCLQELELLDVSSVRNKKNIWDKVHDWWWFKIRKVYDFGISKRYSKELSEDNYTLRETDILEEVIVMKCELIRLKSIFIRKMTIRKLKINIYSKSGKIIYSKLFILDKNKLIQEQEIEINDL